MDSMRLGPGNRAAMAAIAITSNTLDPGMALQPSLDLGRFATRQDIDDPPPLQIADHRSVTPAAPPGPIVDPDHTQAIRRTSRFGADTAKERILADRQRHALRECLGGPTVRKTTEMTD